MARPIERAGELVDAVCTLFSRLFWKDCMFVCPSVRPSVCIACMQCMFVSYATD